MKRNKITNILLASLIAVGSLIGVFSVNVFAAQNTMTVSPPYQKMVLVPGETYRNSVVVFNSAGSASNIKYRIEIGSFSQHSNGGNESKDDYDSLDHVSVSSYNQIMDWIKLDKTSGELAPNETAEVGYSIEVPENAPAGGQYATILVVNDASNDTSGEENITIKQEFQFASIIYAEVAGETKQDGIIIDNNVPAFSFSSPLTVSSMVENNGNVHTDAEYTLEVWPLFSDEEVYTNANEPKTSLILPETKRYNTQTWDEAPSFGIFKVRQTVKLFGDVSTVEKTVIICPLWLLLVIVFIIVAIIIWLITRSKTRKSRKTGQAD